MQEQGETDAIAVSRQRAADLAGVSVRRIDYWASTDLIRPSITGTVGAREKRLYRADELLQLLVTVRLISYPQISLQHVRRVVEVLRATGAALRPLKELRFAVLGDEMYVQLADGSWFGDKRPTQTVLAEVLPLEPLRAQIRDLGRRPETSAGRISRRRGVMGSKPVFEGTRTPVEVVRGYLAHGFDEARILESFPHLTSADIAAARKAVA